MPNGENLNAQNLSFIPKNPDRFGAYSEQELSELCEGFGADYQSPPARNGETSNLPPLEGFIFVNEIGPGLVLSASEVCSMRSGTHSGKLPRSVTVKMHMGGTEISGVLGKAMPILLQAGEAISLSLSEPATLEHIVEQGEGARTVAVVCQPELLENRSIAAQLEHLTETTQVRRLRIRDESWEKAQQLFSQATSELTRKLLSHSLAYELLAEVVELQNTNVTASHGIPRRDIDALETVREHMDHSPTDNHSLTALARIAGMSTSKLKRKFPELFGVSVFGYLRQVRLERAREALELRRCSIAQAAHFAGYQHASNFSAAFRKHYGISPSEL